MIFFAIALIIFLAVFFRSDLTPEDTRHDHFVAALWPHSKEPGRFLRFTRTPAVLYQDPDYPLTWHVCTATGCGRYYEDVDDAEKSK